MLMNRRKNLIEGKLANLGLELIVVIVGILIAFEIDRWALEGREREQEHHCLRLSSLTYKKAN